MIERRRLLQAAQAAMDDQTGVLDAKAAPVVDAVLDGLIDVLSDAGPSIEDEYDVERWLRDIRDGMR